MFTAGKEISSEKYLGELLGQKVRPKEFSKCHIAGCKKRSFGFALRKEAKRKKGASVQRLHCCLDHAWYSALGPGGQKGSGWVLLPGNSGASKTYPDLRGLGAPS